ncbi:MAG: hypothetical protein KDK36_20085 [Leptospiraceae bacterium]|nr:hypothetical protein [Leptospiraceae bacterium]
MNIKEKFLVTFGESVGIVLGYTILYGTIWFLIKTLFIRFFSYIGIGYFAERAESYKWIGQYIIEARAILNADRVCFYRTSNGKSYIYNNGVIPNNIKIYAIVNKTKNKGIYPLPDSLSNKYFSWFNHFHDIDFLKTYFQTDIPKSNTLRNDLNKFNILSYMVLKICSPDKNELYGFVIFTWSNIKSMPPLPDFDLGNINKGYKVKNSNLEYLESLSNSLYSEIDFLSSNRRQILGKLANKNLVKRLVAFFRIGKSKLE